VTPPSCPKLPPWFWNGSAKRSLWACDCPALVQISTAISRNDLIARKFGSWLKLTARNTGVISVNINPRQVRQDEGGWIPAFKSLQLRTVDQALSNIDLTQDSAFAAPETVDAIASGVASAAAEAVFNPVAATSNTAHFPTPVAT